MSNLQNLKPLRSVSEAREMGKKGGEASGKARRKKKEDIKAAKAIVEELFKHKIKDKSGRELTTKEAMLKKLMYKAVNDGSLSAINMLLSIVGESPVQKIAHTDSNGNDIDIPVISSPELLAIMERRIDRIGKDKTSV